MLQTETLQEEQNEQVFLDDRKILSLIRAEVNLYQLDASVMLSDQIVSGAMVDNEQYQVLVQRGLRLSEKSAKALCHNVVGVHLVTAANARTQSLKLFRLVVSGSTETQEGLAVYMEHRSGYLSRMRLRILALQVVAVRCILDGFSFFFRTWQCLTEEYGATHHLAFTIATRMFRGGGFTKDHVYLRGFLQAVRHDRSERDWTPLLIGKGSFETCEWMNTLLNKGVLELPHIRPRALDGPSSSSAEIEHLLASLATTNTS